MNPEVHIVEGKRLTSIPEEAKEAKKSTTVDPYSHQPGGTHYINQGIQPIAYIFANNLNFAQGNVIKYITRYKNKGKLEDLEKAKHYVEFLIHHDQTTKG